MANYGGAREGAGRPKGKLSKKNQELRDKCAAEGLMPLDVLLGDMRYYSDLGAKELEAIYSGKVPDKDERVEKFKAALGFKAIARECAKDAAPYLHPRLASTTVKGDKDNPVQMNLEVTFVGTKATS